MCTSKNDVMQIDIKISNNQEIHIMRFFLIELRNDRDEENKIKRSKANSLNIKKEKEKELAKESNGYQSHTKLNFTIVIRFVTS